MTALTPQLPLPGWCLGQAAAAPLWITPPPAPCMVAWGPLEILFGCRGSQEQCSHGMFPTKKMGLFSSGVLEICLIEK